MDEKDIRALVEQAYDDVSNAMSEPLEKPKEEEEMAMRFKPKMEAWKIRAMRGELSSTLDSGVNPDDLYFGFTASNKTILRTQITDRSPVVDKVVKKDTAGEQWFSIPAQELTPDVKKELQILKMRGYIDPKRHYKKDKQTGLPKYFQMGTVVAGPTEFFSSRLVNKDRHRSMVDELLADVQTKQYAKKQFTALQEKAQGGGKMSYKKRQQTKVPSWKRQADAMAKKPKRR